MKRTGAMVILAVVAVMAGIVAVIDTIRYLEWLFSPLSFVGSPFLGAALSAIVALIWFATAAQIWRGDPRGWLFMVSIATIFLILDAISLIAGTPIELLLPSIVMSALALVLCLLPSTKREFGTE
jgi:hypothetical protein